MSSEYDVVFYDPFSSTCIEPLEDMACRRPSRRMLYPLSAPQLGRAGRLQLLYAGLDTLILRGTGAGSVAEKSIWGSLHSPLRRAPQAKAKSSWLTKMFRRSPARLEPARRLPHQSCSTPALYLPIKRKASSLSTTTTWPTNTAPLSFLPRHLGRSDAYR